VFAVGYHHSLGPGVFLRTVHVSIRAVGATAKRQTEVRSTEASGCRMLAGPPDIVVLQRLAQLVSEVPVMADPGSRQQVVDAMHPAISAAIPRRPEALLDSYRIIRTCLEHRGGLTELVSAIRQLAGENHLPLLRVEAFVRTAGLEGR
jgi:hypothetical protein